MNLVQLFLIKTVINYWVLLNHYYSLQNCAKITGKDLKWNPTFSKTADLAI